MIEKSYLDIALNIEPGDEVVEAVRKHFAASGHGASLVIASGEIEDAEIRVLRSNGAVSSERTSLVWPGSSDLISLTGTVTPSDASLRVSIARESDHGHEVRGGILVRAVAVSVQGTLRALGEPEPKPMPVAVVEARTEAPDHEVRTPIVTDPKPVQSQGAAPHPAGPPPAMKVPRPPSRGPVDEFNAYPEENDVVTHFHFGRCTVLSSDGERLRLQQERDGRVREVALSMLRIGAPTVLEDGRKHWDLARKN